MMYSTGLYTAALALMLVASCVPKALQKGGNSNSLLASTEGFAQEDLERFTEKNFTLNCSNDSGQAIQVNPIVLSKETMEFSGEQLEEGMDCFLSVRGEIDPLMKYTWLGVDADGKPEAGLYYMSENATIKDGKLKLPIVRLYSVTPSDSFAAQLVVYFNGSEKMADAENSDEYSVNLSAEMTCNIADKKTKIRSLPGTKIEGQNRVRRFQFADLSVKDMKPSSCEMVSVYEGNTSLVYRSAVLVPPLLFATAEVGGTVALSARVDPYVAPEPFKRVDSQIKCLIKNADERCTKVELPLSKNAWFAEVVAYNKSSNQNFKYYVTAPSGVEPNELKTVDISTLNLELAGLSISSYKVYRESARSLLLAESFPSLADLSVHEESFSFSASNVEFEFILNTYVHGFHAVDPAEQKLSGQAKANERWIALTEISKDGFVEAQFLVTGADQYFGSERRQDGKLFDWQAFVAENKANAGTNYSVYTFEKALQGEIGLSCATPLSAFIDGMSQKDSQEIQNEQSEINYCQVNSFPKAYLDGYTAEAKVYVYGWKAL